MLIGEVLALSPVVVVLALAIRELRPWSRDYRRIRALPDAPFRGTGK
jgi:hypothetical protein